MTPTGRRYARNLASWSSSLILAWWRSTSGTSSTILLMRLIQGWSLQRTSEAVVGALRARGVPVGLVRDPRTLNSNPQLLAIGYYEEVDHRVVGRTATSYCSVPVCERGSLGAYFRPTLGQHDSVILDELGVSEEEQAVLEEQGIIASWPANVPTR